MTNLEEGKLFYLCSLIEQISRDTCNTKNDLFRHIAVEQLKHYYDLADVYHCMQIAEVSDEIIQKYKIPKGNRDLGKFRFEIPSVFTIGGVYERIVIAISNNPEEWLIKLEEIMTSWFPEHIDYFDSSMYWENISYQTACYESGEILSW